MKVCKVLVSVLLVCILCLSLCSCGISKEEAVGTWSGTYVYNGSQFSVAFVLSESNSYTKIVYKDGAMHKTEIGTYEISGGKVVMKETNGTGGTTTYKYKGKALVNNDHEFFKVN